MLPIKKTYQPPLLLRYQRAKDAQWDGPNVIERDGSTLTFTQVKEELRRMLVEEQHYLCAYCMRRISLDAMKTRVEHVQSQKNYPLRQLYYTNMVACCKGESATKPGQKVPCCDQSKSYTDLSFNPADPRHDISLRLTYQHGEN